MPVAEARNGHRFHYADHGAGEPLILLHCSAGSHGAWRGVAAALGPGFRIVAPDLLGYGANAPWPRGEALAPDAEVAIVEALLDRIGGRVHIVGHSYGGTVALGAAAHCPGRIASLVLIEPVAFHLLRHAGKPDEWEAIRALAQRHMALVGRGLDAEAAEAFMGFWIGGPQWRQLPAALRAEVVRTAPKVAAEWRLCLEAADDRATLAGVACPVLLAKGARTRTVMHTVMDLLAALLTSAARAEIAGAGHMSPQTHAAEIAALVRRHVEAARPAGRAAAA